MSVWTCDVQSFVPSGSGVVVAAVIADGSSQKFQQSFVTNGTKADLRAQVNALTSAKDQLTVKGDITLGPLDLTPDVVTPPVLDPDLAPFLANLQNLRRSDRAQADGLTTSIDAAAARSAVQSALSKHPAYEGYL